MIARERGGALTDVLIREVPHGGEDYRALVALRDAVLRAPLGLRFSAEELAAEVKDRHFGAFREGLLLGTAMLVPLGAGRAQVRQMAVAAEARERGIGRILLRRVEEEAARAGCCELIAEARSDALAFYLKQGYAVVGEPYVKMSVPHRDIVKKLA
jgi:GNAT superfamily N-acetyltransferase